jgi:hypothetical protein
MTKQVNYTNLLSAIKSGRQKVELGYPANLAQFCFDAEEIPAALPLEKLLKQTIKNCRRLRRVRLEELRPYARGMTEFPRLLSLRTSQKELRRWLGPSGINLSADRGPAYRFNAHWPEDEFATVAEEFVFKLWGTPPCEIPIDVWRHVLRPGMRLAFRQPQQALICSYEHEEVANRILVIHFAQTGAHLPAIGAQPVDPNVETLTAALRTIRDRADAALREVEQSGSGQRALGWKCTGCGHVKRFTRPVPTEVAAPCPKCNRAKFEPC